MGLTRSFVAVMLPEDVAARLAGLVRGDAGRAVAPENLHLTLAFLGELEDSALEAVHESLASVRAAPVDIAFGPPGTFGRPAPRQLWLSVAPSPALSDLHRQVQRAIRDAGVTLERRKFVPHVTLARFGSRGAPPMDRVLRDPGGPLPSFRAAAFSLVASALRPDGPVYEELASYPLLPA